MAEFNSSFVALFQQLQQMLEDLGGIYVGRQPIVLDTEDDANLWTDATIGLKDLGVCQIILTDIANLQIDPNKLKDYVKSKVFFEVTDFKTQKFIEMRTKLLADGLIKRTRTESIFDLLNDNTIRLPKYPDNSESFSRIFEQKRADHKASYDAKNPDTTIQAILSYGICASVVANGKTYALPAHEGVTDNILSYVTKNNLWGHPIKKSELINKMIIKGGRNAQFTTILRSGLFGKDRPLAPFVDMSSHTIIVHKNKIIKNCDLEKIKKNATSIK